MAELIIGIVAGILGAVLVSRYYYLRTKVKSLRVFVQSHISPIFSVGRGIDGIFTIIYRDKIIANPSFIEFVVANDGEHAIANVIEPLRLVLPQNVNVLEVSIRLKSDESLSVDVIDNGLTLTMPFTLLNPREFFVVRTLLNGVVNYGELQFTIVAPDLARKVPVNTGGLSPIMIGPRHSREKMTPRVIDYIFAVLAPISVMWLWYVYVMNFFSRPELFPIPWQRYQFSLESLLLLLPALPILGLLTFVVVGIIFSFAAGSLPERWKAFFNPQESNRKKILDRLCAAETAYRKTNAK